MKQVRLAICHKIFTKNPGLSHIGLGVSAANNIKILKDAGIEAEVKILNSDLDFLPFLRQAQKQERPYNYLPTKSEDYNLIVNNN